MHDSKPHLPGKPLPEDYPPQGSDGADSKKPPETKPHSRPSSTGPDIYPTTVVTMAIMTSCVLSMFLISLDRTILGTAIPRITEHFHSTSDIGWYGSSYMLTNCSVQLLYGRLYKMFPTKSVFLTAIALFEVGSVVCGAAPSSRALIIGRAIAGIGSAGIMSGTMQIMVHVVPLDKRPIYGSLFGAAGAVAAVAGPLLGGVLTERVSWRWCFYINLPFGAVAVVAVISLLGNYPLSDGQLPLKEKFGRLDLLGTVIFVPAITCLILALEWGGSSYPWNNWRIILLFVLFGVLFMIWVAVQIRKQGNATVPPGIFLQRSVCASFVYATTLNAAMLIIVYYLPIWFQAVKSKGPVQSGVSLLPTILSLVGSSIASGILTQKIGYYSLGMNVAPIFASTGTGLLTTLRTDSSSSRWIPYQILTGLGFGMGLQQPNLAVQTVLPKSDVPIGIAIVFFGQQLGGAVFLAIAETIFYHQLETSLGELPGYDPASIAHLSAADLRHLVPSSILEQVLSAYNGAVTNTIYLAVGASCAVIVPAMCVEWKNIRQQAKDEDRDEGESDRRKTG